MGVESHPKMMCYLIVFFLFVALGAAYPSETSTFGPTRHNVIGTGAQQHAGNTVADPHVVYSTATSISAGDAAGLSAQRGYHPYGR